jgi:RNA polymerase sigma-70 factor (ECF subfamily)
VADSLSFDLGALSGTALPAQDGALLEGLRTCQEWAFEELILRFQQPVYNLVYRLCADPEDAPDVVQEVFLKVFRNIGSFRANASLKTWIYRIAVNEAHNQRRWFSRHRNKEVCLQMPLGEDLSLEEVLPDETPSPFDQVANQELRAAVEQALGQINPMFRDAVVLRDLEGLSYDEIAEVLGVSLGTVKSRILRGRIALEQQLRGPAANPRAAGLLGIRSES